MLRNILLIGAFLLGVYLLRLFAKVLDKFISRQIIPEEIREQEQENEACTVYDFTVFRSEPVNAVIASDENREKAGKAEMKNAEDAGEILHRVPIKAEKEKLRSEGRAADMDEEGFTLTGGLDFIAAGPDNGQGLEDDINIQDLLDKLNVNKLNKKSKSGFNRVQVGSAPPTQIRMQNYE